MVRQRWVQQGRGTCKVRECYPCALQPLELPQGALSIPKLTRKPESESHCTAYLLGDFEQIT